MRDEIVRYVVDACAADAEGETLQAVIDGLSVRFGAKVRTLAKSAPARIQDAKALDDNARWIAYYKRSGCKSPGEFCKSAAHLPLGLYSASHRATQEKMLAGEKRQRAIKADRKRLEKWLKRLPTNKKLQAKVAECEALLTKIAGSKEWIGDMAERSARRWAEASQDVPNSIEMFRALAQVELELLLREQAKGLAGHHDAQAKRIRKELRGTA